MIKENAALEEEIERSLNELSSAISKLTTILDDPTVPPSSSQLHAVQRHREVLLDFERDYRRSHTNVKHALDRRNLLGSVKVDIDKYRAQHSSDTNALLSERGHIDNSHQMIDSTLDQAYATRADLSSQRSTLKDITTRMSSTANQIPGLNNIIRLISRRRRRDSIIMGCVIGICTTLLLLSLAR
jgi:Golgi SNAP receptor complex protein 1